MVTRASECGELGTIKDKNGALRPRSLTPYIQSTKTFLFFILFYFILFYFISFYLTFCIFDFSRAIPMPYGGSQAKGLIRAVATGL